MNRQTAALQSAIQRLVPTGTRVIAYDTYQGNEHMVPAGFALYRTVGDREAYVRMTVTGLDMEDADQLKAWVRLALEELDATGASV